MVSEILVLEIWREETLFWVWIQFGNLGPKLQDVKFISSNWKGGTQSRLNSKESKLLNKTKYYNLERFNKRDPEITPYKKFEETNKTSILYRFLMLLGKVPFNLLVERYISFKDGTIAKLGNNLVIWLYDKSKTSNESFAHLDKLFISSTSCPLRLFEYKYNSRNVQISPKDFGMWTSLLKRRSRLSSEEISNDLNGEEKRDSLEEDHTPTFSRLLN